MRWIVCLILVGCRDGTAPSPTPAPDPPARARAGSATGSPRPTLAPEEPEPAPPPELATDKAFETETVDRAWKATTEAEIHRRVPTANAIECRATLCKLTFVGGARTLTKTFDELETETSLRGIAESILLGAPAQAEDGTLTVHAFARFARSQ